ncbi:unnamed protein product [Dovyalis caffra]|uniref:Uncharacterized protein n=1 Tax=Dovyalis caffra TaxID=77055 RepID=A0AAV1QYR5_9ROSI|nr:unnamed protein product [Dovyalis caffra]
MAPYLYSVTPFEFLCQDNGKYGSYFLQCAIDAQMLASHSRLQHQALAILRQFAKLNQQRVKVMSCHKYCFVGMESEFPVSKARGRECSNVPMEVEAMQGKLVFEGVDLGLW